jgi:UDP-N-acetylmuramoylalanine--D-glutamate ligase
VYVLEMSSYQLEASVITEFDIGILLNITSDHLDRHGGMSGYVYAKQLIFKGMKGFGIIGVDEPQTKDIYAYLSPLMKERLIPISIQKILDFGYSLQGTHILRNGQFLWDMDEHTKLKGAHNGQNMMAVWAALSALGFADEDIRKTILEFQGLEHRQEYILETPEGLVFINDSKATNAEATIQALKAYTDVYLILGGRPKEGGIQELIPYFDRIRHALLIGEAALEFSQVLEKYKVPFTLTENLENTLNFDFKSPGTVLFSPACASFDQFNNFEERGRAFKKAVYSAFGGRTMSSSNDFLGKV